MQSFLFLPEISIVSRLLGFTLIITEILRVEYSESTKEYQNHVFLKIDILIMVAQNPSNNK